MGALPLRGRLPGLKAGCAAAGGGSDAPRSAPRRPANGAVRPPATLATQHGCRPVVITDQAARPPTGAVSTASIRLMSRSTRVRSRPECLLGGPRVAHQPAIGDRIAHARPSPRLAALLAASDRRSGGLGARLHRSGQIAQGPPAATPAPPARFHPPRGARGPSAARARVGFPDF